MYELTISGELAAAHFLRGYQGPCQELHGHTWKLEVTVQSGELNALGLVVDFKELKSRLQEILKPLDHGCLNDRPAFQTNNPTTENLAKYVYEEFSRQVEGVRVKNVRVWESDSSSVSYSV
jgi:6-pyruvoyltetrahydropterin/6-carboxytetrahydropterin synthase